METTFTFRSAFLALFIILGIMTFSNEAYGQSQGLIDFNTRRIKTHKTSMYVLGGWAVGNIAVGAALIGQHKGSERHFHEMNIAWNVVNFGLATLGYFATIKEDPANQDLYSSIMAHQSIQKTFLFNAGLDVGYVLGGIYLMERSKNVTKNADRFKGWGKSIVLQGSFLFVFDLAAYLVQSSQNKKLKPLLEGLSFDGQSLGLSIQF